MIRRVYLKAIQLTHLSFGSLLLLFEKVGLLKKIKALPFKKLPGVTNVAIPYPLNIDQDHKALFAHYTGYETNDLEVFKFNNVNVSASGAVFKGLNNSVLSFPHPIFRKQFGLLYILKQYWFFKKQSGEREITYVVIFDLWAANNYYHWLVDALPRLLLVKQELEQSNYSLLLPRTCSKFVLTSLKYFNIKEPTFIEKGCYFSAQNILLPNYTAGSGHIHPSYVKQIRSYFLKSIDSSIVKERVYVSRAKQRARKIHNEQEVIDVLLPFGFEVIYWEDLSFEEQVKAVRNTSVLVTSHGANLTNAMFMPDNASVLELIRHDKPNFCYWALTTVTDKNYYYQLCDVVNHDDLLVDIEQFKINLQKLLND